mgnify:CR=1 FL=1
MKIKDCRGKLVVVAHWSDFKLEDATKLGILTHLKDGYFYILGDSRGYRYCRLVCQKQIICENLIIQRKNKK